MGEARNWGQGPRLAGGGSTASRLGPLPVRGSLVGTGLVLVFVPGSLVGSVAAWGRLLCGVGPRAFFVSCGSLRGARLLRFHHFRCFSFSLPFSRHFDCCGVPARRGFAECSFSSFHPGVQSLSFYCYTSPSESRWK